jgi:hypothetical protein
LTQPTLMFCVGATKAGTSWLYSYLHGHEDCVLQSVKESHFFDTISKPRLKPQIDAWKAQRDMLVERRMNAIAVDDQMRATRLKTQIDDLATLIKAVRQRDEGIQAYHDYLFAGAQDAKLVGDHTPAYALLDEERLAQMLAMSENVKFVFLMRDPIDRLWSHVRMIAKRTTDTSDGFEAKSRAVLKSVTCEGGETHLSKRGDYPAIVAKLKNAVPKDKLYFEYFERLLTDDGIRDLCDFLGISYVPANTDKKVHEGKSLKMDDEMRGWAAKFTAPHYAFVKETFGALPERWQTNMARVN